MRFYKQQTGSVIFKKRFTLFPKTMVDEPGSPTIWLEWYYKRIEVVIYPYCNPFKKITYHLPESKIVQDYLISVSPLAKVMSEINDD